MLNIIYQFYIRQYILFIYFYKLFWKMLTSVRKKKEKHNIDKEIQDEVKQIKALLTQGKMLFERASSSADYQAILLIMNKGISKRSSNHIANSHLLLYYRGMCYFNLKEFEKAEKDFTEGITITEQKAKGPLYSSLGKCKFQMSSNDATFLEDAIKCFQKAVQINKSDGESYLYLAKIYRKMKSNNEAIKEATNAISILKQPFQAYIQRGICLRENKEIQKSVQDFQKACELNRNNASALFNLGMSYLLVSRYDEGLQKLTAAIELDPHQPQYHNYKGLALYLVGQYETCLSVFRETLKLYEQKNIQTIEVGQCWYNYGNALLYSGKSDEALQAFEAAQTVPLTDEIKLKIFYAEGLTYQEKQNYPSAIQKFSSSIKIIQIMEDEENQLYLSSYYHLSENFFKNKEFDQAIESVNKIINLDCKDKCVYELRGKIYLEIQMYEKALKDFEIIATMQPSYPEVYFYLGSCKAHLKDIDAAIADFFKALQLGSRNVLIFNGLSCAYLYAEKPEKALIYSNFALDKEPDNETFLIQRSMILLDLGQKIKGIQDLTKALSKRKTNPLIYYKRGFCYYENHEFQEAITDLEKALTLNPAKKIESDIYYLIGISKANLQDFEAAIDPLSQAINLKAKPKFYHERAKCCLLLDRNKEALSDLNEVLKCQENNAFAYFRRAFAHKALKSYEQAAEDFMKARELAPDNPLLIINKKQIYGVKYRKLCEAGEEE